MAKKIGPTQVRWSDLPVRDGKPQMTLYLLGKALDARYSDYAGWAKAFDDAVTADAGERARRVGARMSKRFVEEATEAALVLVTEYLNGDRVFVLDNFVIHRSIGIVCWAVAMVVSRHLSGQPPVPLMPVVLNAAERERAKQAIKCFVSEYEATPNPNIDLAKDMDLRKVFG